MSYQIEFRHLYYFKTVAEELHFRKAAEKLFITQPGLTRQIKQLEELYEVNLFDRNSRSVKLTTAGNYLKTQVDQIFNHLEQTKTQLLKISEGKVAELTLGFIGSAVQLIIPELLSQLKNKQPLIDINLQELSNEAQIKMLKENDLDFGFVRNYLEQEDLKSIQIYEEHFSLVVPKDAMINKPFNFSDYKNMPFILFSKDYSSSYYELVMSIFNDFGFKPNIALRTVNALTIFQLVEQGLGVAIVPNSLKEGYQINANFIELKNIRQRTNISIVWNNTNKNPGINYLLECLNSILPIKR